MLNTLKDDIVKLFKECKAAGMTLSLDTGFDPKDEWKENIQEVLDYVCIALFPFLFNPHYLYLFLDGYIFP